MGALARHRVRKLTTVSQGAPPPAAGWIVGLSEIGQVLVDYAGNPHGSLVARTALAPCEQPAPGTSVLLVFENGDETLPIIVGIVRDHFETSAPSPTSAALKTRQQIVIDVDSLLVNAGREIVFRCGEGSVTIQSDGSIVVRGTKVLSRSTGMNRIQGGGVRIN
jgi:hypothetical protein